MRRWHVRWSCSTTTRIWKRRPPATRWSCSTAGPSRTRRRTGLRLMAAVARDEVEHLAIVSRLLARRGGKLTRQHGNPYACELHKLVRKGRGKEELIDRLI